MLQLLISLQSTQLFYKENQFKNKKAKKVKLKEMIIKMNINSKSYQYEKLTKAKNMTMNLWNKNSQKKKNKKAKTMMINTTRVRWKANMGKARQKLRWIN